MGPACRDLRKGLNKAVTAGAGLGLSGQPDNQHDRYKSKSPHDIQRRRYHALVCSVHAKALPPQVGIQSCRVGVSASIG